MNGMGHEAFGKYLLMEKVATGGMAELFRAKITGEQGFEKLVALKRLFPHLAEEDEVLESFIDEAKLAALLTHQNIVQIYDFGSINGSYFIAMEYLSGGDLRHRIDEGIAEKDAVSYLKQIASALSAIHHNGVLHRDLKPANIMLRGDGTIALIDFGLAKRARLESSMTDKGEIFGTPYYMSPEQGHGSNVDERSDIYSLGIIFFEMLTGKKPFKADSAMGIIYLHAQAPIPLLSTRFSKYQALINMMLAKNPDDRLQSAAEIVEWL